MISVYIAAAFMGAGIACVAFGTGVIPALAGATVAAVILTVWAYSDGSDNETDL